MPRVQFLDDFHRSDLNELERDPEPPSKRKLDKLFRALSKREQKQVLKKLSERKRRPRRKLTVPYAAEFSTSCGRSRVPLQGEIPDSKPTVMAVSRCPHGCLCRPGETTSPIICTPCRMGWPAWDDTRKLSIKSIHTITTKNEDEAEEKDILTNAEVRQAEQSPDDEVAFSCVDEVVDEHEEDESDE